VVARGHLSFPQPAIRGRASPWAPLQSRRSGDASHRRRPGSVPSPSSGRSATCHALRRTVVAADLDGQIVSQSDLTLKLLVSTAVVDVVRYPCRLLAHAQPSASRNPGMAGLERDTAWLQRASRP